MFEDTFDTHAVHYAYDVSKAAKGILVACNFMRATDNLRLVRDFQNITPTRAIWNRRMITNKIADPGLVSKRITKKTSKHHLAVEALVDAIELHMNL